MSIDERLAELEIDLPDAPSPVGSYVPYVESNSMLYISGQIPTIDGKLAYVGKVPGRVSVKDARNCAKICFLNAISHAKNALGSLDKIVRIVRMTGYVASSSGFTDQATVVNGASDFSYEIFGERGKHARLAVGVCELPLGAPIELEVILQI
ncbi:MAG: RidA family protein [Nitrospinota bacterium]|nr:RidA family protein [Nitrospinota bacterium]